MAEHSQALFADWPQWTVACRPTPHSLFHWVYFLRGFHLFYCLVPGGAHRRVDQPLGLAEMRLDTTRRTSPASCTARWPAGQATSAHAGSSIGAMAATYSLHSSARSPSDKLLNCSSDRVIVSGVLGRLGRPIYSTPFPSFGFPGDANCIRNKR